MYVEAHGVVDGTPITFLHGAMVSGWMWMGQVEALTHYHCLLPDYPGIGNSGDLQWVSCADTADRIAEMIRTRCKGGSSHIVGLSLGGTIALHIAVRHPDVVRSLLISGVPQGRISLPLRLFSRLMTRLYSYPWGANVLAGVMGIPADESRQAFVQTAMQTRPGVLDRIMDEIYDAPLPLELARASAPTLAVVGERDTAPAKRAVPHLCAVLPHSQGYQVPGVGHQWNAEQPELFTQMVREWVESGHVVPELVKLCGGKALQ